MTDPIYVTKPYLPPLEEYLPYLEEIWKNRILTNGGPFHAELERELGKYLGVENICLFNNATIALVVALQALRIRGEVITTPYSFVATAHSILWNGLTPVFVDIDETTLNLSPKLVEEAVTNDTTAVLGVHVYGTPCDVDALENVSQAHGLRILYDAAHAFAIKKTDESILRYGDLSILSFHATKVYNTFEGGAIVCSDPGMKRRIDFLKNFGFADETTIVSPGINGKMNEMQAAMGLLQLRYIDDSIRRRGEIDAAYRSALSDVTGVRLLPIPNEATRNFSYFPILIQEEYPICRDELYQSLKDAGIFARRYFYPLISSMPMYKHLPSASEARLPVAHKIARQVLCLPIYPELERSEIERVVEIIRHPTRSFANVRRMARQ